jgi:alkylation response protein AidB-like acyl-CoA dehydrogenase
LAVWTKEVINSRNANNYYCIDLIGTPEQKEKYPPPICSGRMKMGMAITEPDAGSDVSAVSTEARRQGDEYVINGGKVFITNYKRADFLVVLCVTDPQNSKVHSRIPGSRMCIPERPSPGLPPNSASVHGIHDVPADPDSERRNAPPAGSDIGSP